MIRCKDWVQRLPRRPRRPTPPLSPPSVAAARKLQLALGPPYVPSPPPIPFYTPRLQHLPLISESAGAAPARLRPREDLERELVTWRRACATTHAELSLPYTHSRGALRAATKMAAHTMGIMLRLERPEMAREVDRAFFTTELPGEVEAREGEEELPREWYAMGKGLGIRRGGVRSAWMHSLALRLDETLYDGLDDFKQLFSELQEAPSGTVGPTFVAFLERQANILGRASGPIQVEERIDEEEEQHDEGSHEVVEEQERDDGNGRVRLRPGKHFGEAEVVQMAIIETELLFQESHGAKQRHMEDGRYLRLQGSVQELLEEIDINAASRTTDDIVSQSQRLHIAIRFLLVRARLSHTIFNRRDQRSLLAHSMESTYTLYDNLLALLPLVSYSPAALKLVKERQTAALYRLLWASIGSYDASQQVEPEDEIETREDEEATPPADFHLVHSAWTSLDHSIASLSANAPTPDLPIPCPRLLAVSTTFWRRALYALTLPSSPTRRASTTPSTRTPWPLLKRTLELILACKSHDRPPIDLPRTSRDLHLHPIFVRRSLAIHLVRATLLGGVDAGSEGEETVHARLSYLLAFFDALNEEGRGERVKRTVVRSASEVTLHEEFPGKVWESWRKETNAFVARWQEEGDTLNPLPHPPSLAVSDLNESPIDSNSSIPDPALVPSSLEPPTYPTTL